MIDLVVLNNCIKNLCLGKFLTESNWALTKRLENNAFKYFGALSRYFGLVTN